MRLILCVFYDRLNILLQQADSFGDLERNWLEMEPTLNLQMQLLNQHATLQDVALLQERKNHFSKVVYRDCQTVSLGF